MRLSGLNLGGFFSQVKDDVFIDSHLDTFITNDDFKRIKAWGFNSVRLPVDYFFFETAPFKFDESRLKRIENVLAMAEKNKLTAVLDLHKTAGHSFDFKERFNNTIWDKSSDSGKRFLNVWDMLSKRFKNHENVIYELLNEPVAHDANDLNAMYDRAIEAIRSNDKYHSIMLESNLWGICGQFPLLKKFDDNNIIYSFHFYEPVITTHQFAPWMSYVIHDIYKKAVDYPGQPEGLKGVVEKLKVTDDKMAEVLENNDKFWDINGLEDLMKPMIDFKTKHNVPVYCGEFGCVVLAPPKTRQNWTDDVMTLLNKYSIGFGYWSYKNMDFGVVDYTQQYKDNPNYDTNRTDAAMLKILQKGI